MDALVIHNATVITPDELIRNGWLRCEAGRIAAIGTDKPPVDNARVIDAGGGTALPGFIDVHVHGAAGYDVMDADPDGLRKMAQFKASHGVTAFLPTTLTASQDDLLAALSSVQVAMGEPSGGAKILGAHLEGPYLNPAKCGAQDARFIRRATRDDALPLLDVGVIRLLSLAPEYEENGWLITECIQRGMTVSAAHTTATYDEMRRGIADGITHSTHTFNAMPSLHHRKPGGGAALMLSEGVRCELIADTYHVAPPMMDLLWRLVGPERLVLVTDAMRAVGLSEGNYMLADLRATVRDGRATLADGTLAGSVLTMDVALRNLMAATGASLEEVWRATSANAADQLGIMDMGRLVPGAAADLVLLDAEAHVKRTIIDGDIVYDAGSSEE